MRKIHSAPCSRQVRTCHVDQKEYRVFENPTKKCYTFFPLKMQERITPCLFDEVNIAEAEAALVDDSFTIMADVEDVADMVSGYAECMAEAVRYLIEEENYPSHHPAVQALECHLSQYRKRLLQSALYQTGLCPLDPQ